MPCYHFTIKTDKRPDGSRVAATTHIDYIAREGKYKDYDYTQEKQLEKAAFSNILSGSTPLEHNGKEDMLLYRSPFGSIVYTADGSIAVSDDASVETVAIALNLTKQLHGNTLDLTGQDAFKAKALVASSEMQLEIRFSDASLEEKYMHMQEEIANERREFEQRGGKIRRPQAVSVKRNFKQRSLKAVAQRGLRLPKLSERRMVRDAEKPEMFLPGDAAGSVFERRPQHNPPVRWDVSGTRRRGIENTANKILVNLQQNLGTTFAASHVEYINREAAFKQRGGCVYQQNHLPGWADGSAKKFFTAADKYEGANSVRYKEIEFALPNEFTLTQQKELIDAFIEKHLKEFYYTYAVHDKIGVMSNGEHNTHVHIMFSERKIDDAELEKERTANRFFAYPARNPKSLEQKRKGGAKKDRKWESKNRSEYLSVMREDFAAIQNSLLEKYGVPERVDHRSLKVQADEARAKGYARLAEFLDRMPEEHIGPDQALRKNNPKVIQLQKYRAYKEEHRRLLYATELMENSITEDISRNAVDTNTAKAAEIVQTDTLQEKLEDLAAAKTAMLSALKEVHALKRIAIWNQDATEQAKLCYMSLEERELWQTFKHLQTEKNHWIIFRDHLEEPSSYQQDALAAYKELLPELQRKLQDFDTQIAALSNQIEPISQRLTAPEMQKKVQKEIALILWEDKKTKDKLSLANKELAATIETLQEKIHQYSQNAVESKDTYTAKQLHAVLSANCTAMQTKYDHDLAVVQKIRKNVISEDRAFGIAQDKYVHGAWKTLRAQREQFKKEEKYIAQDKKKQEEAYRVFHETVPYPKIWSGKKAKEEYATQKEVLQQQDVSINERKRTLEELRLELDKETNRLNALCTSPDGKAKIEEIALGILKKNQPIAEKYTELSQALSATLNDLKHTKKQLHAVKKQAAADKADVHYKVVASGGGYTAAPSPKIIADAIIGDPKAVQLVARCKRGAGEMDKEWAMMSEIERDEKINAIENLDRY